MFMLLEKKREAFKLRMESPTEISLVMKDHDRNHDRDLLGI